MAHPAIDFLPGRRLFVAGALATLAVPARAEPGRDLLTGTVGKFDLLATPKPLPDLDFTDGEDKPLKLADLRGKALLINFWATWCLPCIKEMPSLDRLQAAMGKDKFLVLPLSLDGPSRTKVVPFYKDRNLANLGIYFDRGKKLMQALDISILPTSILVDPAGRQLGRLEGGADWAKPEAIALMKAAVG